MPIANIQAAREVEYNLQAIIPASNVDDVAHALRVLFVETAEFGTNAYCLLRRYVMKTAQRRFLMETGTVVQSRPADLECGRGPPKRNERGDTVFSPKCAVDLST